MPNIPPPTQSENAEIASVLTFMLSGEWKTIDEIATHIGKDRETAWARLRELRRNRRGKAEMERRNEDTVPEYRLLRSPGLPKPK